MAERSSVIGVKTEEGRRRGGKVCVRERVSGAGVSVASG